jgi:hypothetical protein
MPLFAAMVGKYQDNGGCRWRQRRRRNIGGGSTAAAEKGNGYRQGGQREQQGASDMGTEVEAAVL